MRRPCSGWRAWRGPGPRARANTSGLGCAADPLSSTCGHRCPSMATELALRQQGVEEAQRMPSQGFGSRAFHLSVHKLRDRGSQQLRTRRQKTSRDDLRNTPRYKSMPSLRHEGEGALLANDSTEDHPTCRLN